MKECIPPPRQASRCTPSRLRGPGIQRTKFVRQFFRITCNKTYIEVHDELGVPELPRVAEGPVAVVTVVVELPSPLPTEAPELKARVVLAARTHWMPPITCDMYVESCSDILSATA